MSATGDWDPWRYKGECDPNRAMTGLSLAPSSGRAHALLCGEDDTTKYLSQSAGQETRSFYWGDDRGNVTGNWFDWDPGFHKGECTSGGYVAGVSQETSGATFSILCRNRASAGPPSSCSTVIMQNQDAREPGSLTYDWSVGYYKGECGAGRYVAGVSQSPYWSATYPGMPHALWCCNY